ncbi:MAG: cofactor-independent phosphoglycerate mutase [candidate division WOR-3 bacterium]|uniref:Cofactor-independent phosphoglycerate mutase n=2 Tax=candidate division WOR-3 bacterium TaxID=2052148 RepID=A0A7C3F280_UNCW3|nr:cofactor-independent phosphoglycerate mutase [candidate division WOR-3 bacterium]
MKYLIFLGDGMADYPLPELDGKTPLQVARKPVIDRLARLGRNGTFVTVEPDMPPGSEVANLSVLGYDPKRYYQGRGVIEAASLGVRLEPEDVALRCNLLCIRDGRIKNHSAGHISTEEARLLIEELNRQLATPEIRFYPGFTYRHLCVLKNGSPELECFPPHDHVGEEALALLPRAKSPAGEDTARTLRELILKSWEILPGQAVNLNRTLQGKDPANSIWFWSPGRKPQMPTYQELYGLKGAVIAAVDLIKGLGVYAGFDVIEVPGATGLLDTNYEGKADAALGALADHDFVFVHLEAPDEAGHSRDVRQKIEAIERFDARLVARVMKGIEEQGLSVAVAVLPDHLTPVTKGNHVHGPVPVAIYHPHLSPDTVDRFDEVSARAGILGELHGDQFIRTLLQG